MDSKNAFHIGVANKYSQYLGTKLKKGTVDPRFITFDQVQSDPVYGLANASKRTALEHETARDLFADQQISEEAVRDLAQVAREIGRPRDLHVMCIGKPGAHQMQQMVFVIKMAFLFDVQRIVLWEKLVGVESMAPTQSNDFLPREEAIRLMTDGLEDAVRIYLKETPDVELSIEPLAHDTADFHCMNFFDPGHYIAELAVRGGQRIKVLYTDRYFGGCDADFDLRDCVFYTARCMDGSNSLRDNLEQMKLSPDTGRVLFVGLSSHDFNQVKHVFEDSIIATKKRDDFISYGSSHGRLYSGYNLVEFAGY